MLNKDEEEKVTSPVGEDEVSPPAGGDNKTESQEKMPEVFQSMIDAGVHFGRKKSMSHPGMKPYVFTVRQDVQILNIEKIAEKLDEAVEFLRGIMSSGGIVLFVSVSMPAKHLTKQLAEDLKMPYVFERWIGGTLTNFKVISKRIEYLLKQEEKKHKGELAKYTKKEQLDMDKEMKDLNRKIGGIKTLKKHPDAIFIFDAGGHDITIKEATKIGIPVVAVANTNANPDLVQYPIPANDKSIKSIQFILDYIKNALLESKTKTSLEREAKTEDK